MMKLFKAFFLVVVFAISLGVNAQEVQADSVSTKPLFSTLQGSVKNAITDKPITGAKVKIICIDGSFDEIMTDSLGLFVYQLKRNSAYSFVVEKIGYLNSKGKQSTQGHSFTKVVYHEYGLQPICTMSCPKFPRVTYFINKSVPFIDERDVKEFNITNVNEVFKMYYSLMNENQNLIIQIIGYRVIDEKEKISLKRAVNFIKELRSLGIEKDRLIPVDGGVRGWYLNQENRTVTFKVISDDYEPKKK